MKTFIYITAVLLLSATSIPAQQITSSGRATSTGIVVVGNPTVPTGLEAIHTALLTAATSYQITINKLWTGTKYSGLRIGAELTTIDNPASLTPSYWTSTVSKQLAAFESMGMRAIKIQAFPVVFYQNTGGGPTDYYTFLSDTSYSNRMSVYTSLGTALATWNSGHPSQSIKLICQTGPWPSQNASTNGADQTYYDSLSTAQYTSMIAQGTVAVMNTLPCDYINISPEPSNEGSKVGKSFSNSDITTMVSSTITALEGASITGLHTTRLVVAGFGTWATSPWLTNWTSLPTGAGGIDGVDLHVHAADSRTYLDAILSAATTILASGKFISFDEEDPDPCLQPCGVLPTQTDQNKNFGRVFNDVFIAYATVLINTAHYLQAPYFSWGFPNSFFARLDYYTSTTCITNPAAAPTTGQVSACAGLINPLVFANMTSPPTLTPFGTYYQSLLQ